MDCDFVAELITITDNIIGPTCDFVTGNRPMATTGPQSNATRETKARNLSS